MPSVHRVAAGQTLSQISEKYGVSVASLQKNNGIADADDLRLGQEIRISAAPAAASAKASYRTHRVAPGQTLSHIAKLYRTTVRALQAQNGISDPRNLRGGQVIKVPM
jgi:LysM repeat protein